MTARQRRRRRPTRRPPGPCWCGDWYRGAPAVPSPNFGRRPAGATLTLAVLHAISLPPGRYGGDAIERFFTNRLDPRAHPYFAQIDGLQVSAHFLVRRDGRCLQFVGVESRAWHAGASRWRGLSGRNDDSVGIELEGLEGRRFTAAQYRAAAGLLRALCRGWPIREVVGHEHIAPGRKGDPGPGWDWPRLARRLHGSPLLVTPAHTAAATLLALAQG